jgi:hypothetical protein
VTLSETVSFCFKNQFNVFFFFKKLGNTNIILYTLNLLSLPFKFCDSATYTLLPTYIGTKHKTVKCQLYLFVSVESICSSLLKFFKQYPIVSSTQPYLFIQLLLYLLIVVYLRTLSTAKTRSISWLNLVQYPENFPGRVLRITTINLIQDSRSHGTDFCPRSSSSVII